MPMALMSKIIEMNEQMKVEENEWTYGLTNERKWATYNKQLSANERPITNSGTQMSDLVEFLLNKHEQSRRIEIWPFFNLLKKSFFLSFKNQKERNWEKEEQSQDSKKK